MSESGQPKNADGTPDYSKSGPYSITEVSVEPATAAQNAPTAMTDSKSTWALYVAGITALLSFAAIFFATRKNSSSEKKIPLLGSKAL